RELTPAVRLIIPSADISGVVPHLLAILQDLARLAEGAAGSLAREAVKGEAVLHRHQRGAAERVEPVDRVAADQIEAVDGEVRNQVPVDGVAEAFIDAHAVLVDGKT